MCQYPKQTATFRVVSLQRCYHPESGSTSWENGEWVKALGLGLWVVEPSHEVASDWPWERPWSGKEGCLTTPSGVPGWGAQGDTQVPDGALGLPFTCLERGKCMWPDTELACETAILSLLDSGLD